MAQYVANRVQETALASGLANLTLQGAVTGWRAFADAIPVGGTTIYCVVDGEAWEVGIGTLVSASELSRDTIIDSSATADRVNNVEAGTPVKLSLSSGTHTVICTLEVGNMIFREADGSLADPTPFRSTIFVETIAAMKALNGLDDNETIVVKHGATAGDGLGGIFYFDDDDATSPDNVDTFRNDNYVTGLHKRVRLSRTDLLAKAGGSMTGFIILHADPSSAMHAATKQYVDSVATGLDVKQSVKAATTASITLSGEQTIDGVSVVAGDRVLVKDQGSPSANGIYVVAVGSWARASDMDAWAEVPGAFCWVEQGTANADKAWVATANSGGALGSTAIDWVQFAGAGAYQPIAAALSSWAAVARAIGFDTFTATPSSANFAALLTDKTGSGVAVFSTEPTISSAIFTGDVNATFIGTQPRTDWYDTDAPTDKKRHSLIVDGGILNIQRRTDGDVFVANRVRIGVLDSGDLVDGTPDTYTAAREGVLINGHLDINPTPNTFERGIHIAQSTPTDGTLYVGPVFFNLIDVVVRSDIGEGGVPGNPGSSTYAGLQTSVNAGGPEFYAISVMAASSGVTQTLDDNSISDKNGGSTGVFIDAVTPGRGYGGSAGATITADGEAAALICYEADMVVEGALVNAAGISSWHGGSQRAADVHTAFAAAASGGTGPYGAGVIGWKQILTFFTEGGATNSPVETDTDMFASDHNTEIANVFNFWPGGGEDVVVNGKILGFQYVTLWGNEGLLELKGTSSTQGRVRLYEDTDNGSNYVEITTAANLPGNQTIALDENEWSAFTPALTPAAGTITTATASCRYRRLFGRVIEARFRAVLTDITTGTPASGALTFSLPVAANTSTPLACVSGRESGTTGNGVIGHVNAANSVAVTFYNSLSVFTGGNGTIVDFSVTYEAAA